jgi:arginase
MPEVDSQFGINDCHKLTKKKFNKKNITKKINKLSSPNKIKNIILFPHMLGQSKPGVEKGPAAIEKYIGKKHKITSLHLPGNLYKNLQMLYKANNAISGRRINIGGDHSMSIATIAYTLNQYPDAKVVYFDAHADINTYDRSNSKHYHGMDLAFLTGIDKDKRFPFIKNKLKFENLLYIGSRCFDIFEIDIVKKYNIKYIIPEQINNNYNQMFAQIADFIKDRPFHLSFDIDSIDPKYTPSTGTPVKGGITLKNATNIVNYLYTQNIVNVDITELFIRLNNKKDTKLTNRTILNTVKLFKKYIE